MQICSKFVQLHDSKMRGQKRAQDTELFKDLENSDTKVPQVQCLFCQGSVVKNGTRLKTHIEQCL